MPFIKPMLASPLKFDFAATAKPGEWIAEEKFDGIRLVVEVDRETPADLLSDYTVRSWSRDGIIHAMPAHLRTAFGTMPTGIYDCELHVPKARSFGATRLDHAHKLEVAVFDLLGLLGEETMSLTLASRRELLTAMFVRRSADDCIKLSEARIISSFADVETFRDEVWARDGEGLILKKLDTTYRAGKRDKSWIKIKQLKSAAMTVVGFAASTGQIENRGDYAMVIVKDERGMLTSVKTRNNDWLDKLTREGAGQMREFQKMRIGSRPMLVNTKHPRVGSLLRIEYQEKTLDGSYRHPRWDRWENE